MRIRELIDRLTAIAAAHGDVCVLATCGDEIGTFAVGYEADEGYTLIDLTAEEDES